MYSRNTSNSCPSLRNTNSDVGYSGKLLLWISKRAFSGLKSFPPATTYNLRRCCGRPKYLASRTRHATFLVFPRTSPALGHLPPFTVRTLANPAREEIKQPNAFVLSVKTPSTFSQKTLHLFCPVARRTASLDSIISTNFNVRFPRSSFNPFCHPAREKAWQGVPPQIKSGADILPCLKSPAVLQSFFLLLFLFQPWSQAALLFSAPAT